MKNDTFHFLLTYCTFFALLSVFANYILACATGREDSKILAFRMGSAARGRGLCGVNEVLFRVAKSRLQKMASPFRRARTSQFLDT